MPLALIVHADEDRAFVQQELVQPLPVLGFDWWCSAASPAAANADVAIVVVSQAAARTEEIRTEVAALAGRGRPAIAVLLDGTSPDEVGEALASVATADPRTVRSGDGRRSLTALADLLADVLPPQPAGDNVDGNAFPGAERIGWNAEIFSHFLATAAARHDYSRGEELVGRFRRHLRTRPGPYDARQANIDLGVLRRKRLFGLMERYGESAVGSGTDDLRVRRQYAQALIELGQYGRAVEVLDGIVATADRRDPESFEARGLLGRTYKQQYVNAPSNATSHDLRLAIRAYGSVFQEAPDYVWQGINTASCLMRAARDGVPGGDLDRARRIARAVLQTLEQRERAHALEVWDLATRVEALVVLDDFEAADRALTAYLAHPHMHALDVFEVSSTHRQFVEVLQLDRDPRGARLVERLWQAVERYRAPGMTASDRVDQKRLPFLLRVSTPDWQPRPTADLTIHARLGTVISIETTRQTVRDLLNDPLVIAAEEGRPSGRTECRRSLSFIKAARPFRSTHGPFDEKGDKALIAIVDDGIDVLHKTFADRKTQSCVVGIWDQRDPTGPPPPGFGFGTYHDASAIAGYVAKQEVPEALGRNPVGHGSHVASIAAGRPAGAFKGGMAPRAPLVVVIPDSRKPVGYSQEHLAALAFVERTATALGLPVVVNVSMGMNAGAHDGKSMLENAFDEFCNGRVHPGRVVVKSAGNERDKNAHAQVTLRPATLERLRWERQPDPFWPLELVELWWSPFNDLRFRLVAPSGAASTWVGSSRLETSGTLEGGGPFKMVLTRNHIDNGDDQLVVELGDGVTMIAGGTWQLDIESARGSALAEIHAWIERGGEQPSKFLNHLSEEVTLSVPGTANNVITVGAVDAKLPIEVGDFSSYGPTRDGRRKPDVTAPGIGIVAAKGGTAKETIGFSGTSMAAPFVTGAVALMLSRVNKSGKPWPAASQIASVLRRQTLAPSPVWERGQGYGVIDVARLLTACDAFL